ncbi:MAG: phosphate acyltransferase PlsX [Woeseiaceae bacterium]
MTTQTSSKLKATLALDAMSGDQGSVVVVAAAKSFLQTHINARLILVGDEALLREQFGADHDRVEYLHATQVVDMDESPVDALRKKKQSSMRLAINLVKAGDADACVSAGNTGALMATAKYVLKMIRGIDRPAIMAEIPGKQGRVFLLDVGANTSCTAEQLFQFAIMGSVVTARLTANATPRVALLNIGEEDIKGHQVIREAADLIEQSSLHYVGFIEGNALFSNTADVVVTDGFTGNVALKTMEGTATLIGGFLKQSFSAGVLAKLQGLIALPSLKRLQARMDPRAYNGASLVGLSGIVVKSHGGADAVAFEHAINAAVLEVQDNVPAEINRRLNVGAD